MATTTFFPLLLIRTKRIACRKAGQIRVGVRCVVHYALRRWRRFMHDRLRWGILGTGNIASQFADAMKSSRRGIISAAASRSIDSARRFAERYAILSAYGDYDALLVDPAVDAVYISLPNSLHYDWTIAALQAGKHVLCEKPFAMTAAQSAKMFAEADRAGRVLVEAFMHLSHPQTLAVLDRVKKGAIGELRLVRSSFCYRTRRIEGNIRFDRALGGGAMLDVGCYCTNLACVLAGAAPVDIHATARMHPSGVDEAAAGVLRFPTGLLASFTCGMTVQADNTAYLCGTEGYIEVPVPWKPPARGATYTIAHGIPPRQDATPGSKPQAPPRETITVDADRQLYALEADDFAASVMDGAAPRVPRELTLNNMRTLDAIRAQFT
jgi:predicted dehydrogenase